MNTYPEYKESGAGWLGEVPSHWKIQKLKHVASIETGTTPSTSKEEYYENGTTLWIKPDDLNGLVPIENTKRKLTELGMNESRPLPPNSVLVCGIGSIGKFGVISDAACFNQQINGVSFYPEKMNHRFGLYLIASMESELKRNAEKVVVSILNKSRQSNIRVPTPPIEEQLEIAQFLDEGILKIDLLITEKQSFINLLEEKRQALISHVVTKGLDDSAEMKDSGVEWIGEVPAHWEMGKLKHLVAIRNGQDYKHVETEDEINGYPVYGSGGIFRYATDYLYDGESILFGRKGTVDKPLYVKGRFWSVDTMFYSEIMQNHVGRFIYYLSTTIPFSYYQTNTALPSMTQGDLLNNPVAIPPVSEQQRIADALDSECKVILELIDETNNSISLLKEHRSALISAAVTGKIDVREEV